MKRGLDLAQLSNELEFRNDNRKDWLTNTKDMTVSLPMDVEQSWLVSFSTGPQDPAVSYEMAKTAISQLASLTHMPYTELVRVANKGTVNERKELGRWLTTRLNENPTIRLMRVMPQFWDSPIVAAILDKSHSSKTSYSVLNAILGLSLEVKGLLFESADLTESYMTVVVMGGSTKEGYRAGILFQHSEIGLMSAMRPVVQTPDGINIIPTTHLMVDWDTVTVEQAKETLIGARSAARAYEALVNRKIPESCDLKAFLTQRAGLTPDDVRQICKWYETIGDRTHRSLVHCVARLANRRGVEYARALSYQLEAGQILDFTSDVFMVFKKTEGHKGNGKGKAAKEQGTKRAKAGSKDAAGGPAKPATRQPAVSGGDKGTEQKGQSAK